MVLSGMYLQVETPMESVVTKLQPLKVFSEIVAHQEHDKGFESGGSVVFYGISEIADAGRCFAHRAMLLASQGMLVAAIL